MSTHRKEIMTKPLRHFQPGETLCDMHDGLPAWLLERFDIVGRFTVRTRKGSEVITTLVDDIGEMPYVYRGNKFLVVIGEDDAGCLLAAYSYDKITLTIMTLRDKLEDTQRARAGLPGKPKADHVGKAIADQLGLPHLRVAPPQDVLRLVYLSERRLRKALAAVAELRNQLVKPPADPENTELKD